MLDNDLSGHLWICIWSGIQLVSKGLLARQVDLWIMHLSGWWISLWCVGVSEIDVVREVIKVKFRLEQGKQ